MGMTKKIRLALVERDMTAKQLAEKIGASSSNLSGKMRRDNFSEHELREIAEALDCDFDAFFTLRDTKKQI